MASSKVMRSSKRRNSDPSASSSRSRRGSVSSSSPSSCPPPPSSSTKPPQPLSVSQQPSDRITRNSNGNSNSNMHDLTPSTQPPSTMTIDGILRNVYATQPAPESTLLDAQITLIDTPVLLPQSIESAGNSIYNNNNSSCQDTGSVGVIDQSSRKTVDDLWREIVAGRKEMKEEPDEMMTLEDFLAKAGAVDVGGGGGGGEEDDEVKMPQQLERLSGGVYAFDPVPQSAFQVLDKIEGSIVGFGNEVDAVAGRGGGGGVRGKRGRTAPVLEPLDKAVQQRQRRMIKNRESAARSRERKQAYQVELESLAVRLEEENEQLLKEKEERSRERFKQLMEKVVPVVEKRRPPRFLRRSRSWQW